MNRTFRGFLGLLASVTRRDALDDRLREELRLHVELLTEKNIGLGLPPDEARRQALSDIGGIDQTRERVREARGVAAFEDALRDVRYGLRQLRRTPGFALVAILTIALGIGVTVAIFAALDAVLLRPLPFPEPDRLVSIWEQQPSPSGPLSELQPDRRGRVSTSVPVLLEWQALTSVFENVAARHWNPARMALTGRGEPEEIAAGRVTANYFATLGVQPALGRPFLRDDQGTGASTGVVLSHALWQRRFGGSRDIIGQPVVMSGTSYTVIGVMPASFPSMAGEDVWLAYPLDGLQDDRSRGTHNMEVVARLKRGVPIEQARAVLEAGATIRAQRFPRWSQGMTTGVMSLQADLVGDVRGRLLLLFTASVFVVLIACANLANMMLTRGIARRREMAVRAALGAGSGRLVRQSLAETALLAVLGGAAGLGLGLWASKVLATVGGAPVRDFLGTGTDWRVVAFAAVASISVGLLTALVPTLHAAMANVNDGLKPGSAGAGRTASQRLSHALVAMELAFALVLLAGACLMVSTLIRLSDVNLGFRSSGLLTLRLTLPPNRYLLGKSGWDNGRAQRFLADSLERIRATPGVVGAAAIYPLPFSGKQEGTDIGAEGSSVDLPTHYRMATPGYFETLRTPLIRGRDFGGNDTDTSPLVVIVNETLAQRLWPGQDPIGRRVQLKDHLREVVGVVGDGRHLRPDLPSGAEVYVPRSQVLGYGTMFVAVRTTMPPQRLAPSVQGAIWEVDRNQPIAELTTMDDRLGGYLAVRRIYALTLGLFASLALALAMLGVYGVMSYWVSQRRREIGVRMALGARRREIVAMVLRRGLRVSLVGLVLGVGGSLATTRALSPLLYGVNPADARLLAAASALLGLVALAGCYIPARRATRVDPLTVLRSE